MTTKVRLSPEEAGRQCAKTYGNPHYARWAKRQEFWDAYLAECEKMPVEDLQDFIVEEGTSVCIRMTEPYHAWTNVGVTEKTAERLEGRSIYNLDPVHFGGNHSLEILEYDDESMRLMMSYAYILGGRLVAYVSKASVLKFFDPVRAKQDAGNRPTDHEPSPIENIGKMTASGNRLQLPVTIKFKNYDQVKKILTEAGGKYNKNGFVFEDTAKSIQDRLLAGETIRPKQELQQFYTPPEIVKRVRELAGPIGNLTSVLEPSAGRGALVEGIDKDQVSVCELDSRNAKYLHEQGYNVWVGDFLDYDPSCQYEVILANPPFTRNQDIDHVRHMYELLADGGVLVSIMSPGWQSGTMIRKRKEFRKWMKEIGAEVFDVPEGAFKNSGTNVSTCIVRIRK